MSNPSAEAKCPFHATGGARTRHGAQSNADWWPNQLQPVHPAPAPTGVQPDGPDFDYAEAFKKLDFKSLKKDLADLMTQSQDWWPADYGHYGGLFISIWRGTPRAPTVRPTDVAVRTPATSSCPAQQLARQWQLDKGRRLLWPIKQKYGNAISWADLFILCGNVAMETMGFKTFGFGGGRVDIWAPEDIYWGAEKQWLAAATSLTAATAVTACWKTRWPRCRWA